MKIQFYARSVYGKDLIYLADETATRLWLQLTGKKTITGREMEAISKLTGVEFEQVIEPKAKVTIPQTDYRV